MVTCQSWRWTGPEGWGSDGEGTLQDANLVLYFGAPEALEAEGALATLHRLFPAAAMAGCSTGGEILDDEVSDGGIVATAIRFNHTTIRCEQETIDQPARSFAVGEALGRRLAVPGLRLLFVLSDGMRVNGSELVRGLSEGAGSEVPITGGLAGDGDRFRRTLVGLGPQPAPGQVVAIGFVGTALSIGHGCVGGWDPFGPERLVTRSSGNVLYELDGRPALALYKRYLGEEAADLPGSGLLFPLRVRRKSGEGGELVRSIVNIDEAENSLIFAGDVPQGWIAQLMKGNSDRLVDGAGEAARLARAGMDGAGGLAILISCIGRKILLGQRISNEVEATRDFLGGAVHQIGFYSYGEISPYVRSGRCELHNQTMTVTLLQEH